MSIETAAEPVGFSAGAGEPTPAPPTTSRVKERRRPLLFALMAALVAVGGLLAAWAYTSATDARSVVAVAKTIHRGEVIEQADLRVVQIGTDPTLKTVPGSDLASLVGKKAAMDLPAGGLVTREAVSSELVPASGQTVVGVSLSPAMMPSEPLLTGDSVRLIGTPGDQGEYDPKASPVSLEATVVGVRRVAETGETVVDVTVPHDTAADVASLSATRRIALVLDEREK